MMHTKKHNVFKHMILGLGGTLIALILAICISLFAYSYTSQLFSNEINQITSLSTQPTSTNASSLETLAP